MHVTVDSARTGPCVCNSIGGFPMGEATLSSTSLSLAAPSLSPSLCLPRRPSLSLGVPSLPRCVARCAQMGSFFLAAHISLSPSLCLPRQLSPSLCPSVSLPASRAKLVHPSGQAARNWCSARHDARVGKVSIWLCFATRPEHGARHAARSWTAFFCQHQPPGCMSVSQ